jgi:hypothetical protein
MAASRALEPDPLDYTASAEPDCTEYDPLNWSATERDFTEYDPLNCTAPEASGAVAMDSEAVLSSHMQSLIMRYAPIKKRKNLSTV